MDSTSIIDYIKQTYPKVVFTPFKFQQSRALAFIISDNNLVIGFVNSNGTLCKLIEPVDLNILSSESMRSIIEHIPIVKGFTDEDKTRLIKMFEHKEDTVTKTEHIKAIEELQQKLEKLQDSRPDIQNLVSELSDKNKTLESSLSELTGKNKDLETSLSELSNSNKKLESSIAYLTEKNQDLESTILSLNTSNKEKDNIESSVLELNTKILELSSKNKDLDSTLSELSSKNKDLDSTVSELSSKNKDLDSTVSELSSKNKDLDSTLSELSGKNSDLESTLSELSSKNRDLESTLSELSSKNRDLESTLSELSGKNSGLESSVTELSSKNRDLESTVSGLNTTISELSGKNQDVDSSLSNLNSIIAELTGKNKGLESSISELKEKGSALESSVLEYKTLYDGQSNQIVLIKKQYEDKIESITNQYNDALEQVNECRRQIVDQNQAILDGINKHKDSLKEFIASKDFKIEDLERIHLQDVEERHKLQQRLDDLLTSEKSSLANLQSRGDQILDYEKRLEQGTQRVAQLTDAIDKINAELSAANEELKRSALQRDLLDGYKNRCKEKLLQEKDQVIDAIKEYVKKWVSWVEKSRVDVNEQKRKLLKEFELAKGNLQSVLDAELNKSNSSNKEIQRLKQNILDVETYLKKTINDQLTQLSIKDEIIKQRDQSISDMTSEKSKLESVVSEKGSQINKMQSEIDRLKEINKRIPELQRELAEVRGLLEKNRNTPIQKSIDYDNCYSIVTNFASLNNIFYRKQEIIKKLDDIITNNLDAFKNLNDTTKESIKKDFERVKTEINNHIKFLNLADYISSPNFEYLKSKSSRSRVPESYCKDLANLLEYWEINKIEYREQDMRLTNIYEDLAGAVRIYIRVKPLVGDQKTKGSIELQTIENKRTKSLYVDCSSVPDTKYKDRSSFGEFYGIFEDDFANVDVYTGQRGTVSPSNTLQINTNDIIESSESISPGLYTTFKQVQDGYSVVIFGYGLSGSGKTWTLLGSKGNPGILHYGLANLENVKNIRLKYLFEQYYDKINYNNRQVSGRIHNLVGKIPQLNDLSIDETTQFEKRIPSFINIKSLRVEDIYALTDMIDEYRVDKKRIKQTPNNPYSSRSHLYFVFEIEFTNGKRGFVTIVDTAGRESPLDIFNTFIENTSLASVMAPPPVGGVVNITKNLKPQYKDTYTSEQVFNILNEGFYINETINHLIYYFNLKNGKTIETPKQKIDKRYNVVYKVPNYFVQPQDEMNQIDGNNNSLMIPVLKFLDNLSSRAKEANQDWKPTKFITICCVRQEAKYCDQTMETIQFAQNVKSS
jgi:chromosome segregation ATPase